MEESGRCRSLQHSVSQVRLMHTAVLGRKEPSSNLREDTTDPSGRAVLTSLATTSPFLHYGRGREDLLDFALHGLPPFGAVRVAVLVVTCP